MIERLRRKETVYLEEEGPWRFAFLHALEGRIRAKEGGRHGMYAHGPDSAGEAIGEGLRGVFEDRQHLGASADVSGVRSCGVLRFVSA